MNDRKTGNISDGKLTPQEKRLVECAARGEIWNPELADPNQLDLDPAYAYGWDEDRTIRAEVIRCLASGDIWPGKRRPWPVGAKGVGVNGARITGELDLEGAVLERRLGLWNCAFDERVNLRFAETQSLSFDDSYLLKGLTAYSAHIDGSLFLRDGFSVKGAVDLSGATIEGQLACTGGRFENAEGTALKGNRMTVGKSVSLAHGFSAKGMVDFIGAKIEGQLICIGGRFENANGDALNGDHMIVSSGVYFSDGFSAKGTVNLAYAHIQVALSCIGGNFENANGKALSGYNITVGGPLFLRDGFSAKGAVDISGATIENQLDCTGGRFENAEGTALNGNRMTVRANVYLGDGFFAKGEVNFRNAGIHGNLLCTNATFANPEGDAFDLTLAEIGDGLFLRRLRLPEGGKRGLDGRLILAQAKCRVYSDDRESWPKPGKLVLDGFVYERFHDCPTDWKTRRDWLQRQTKDHLDGSFHPQSWTQAIKVLREMGHDSDAKELAVCREIARTKSKSTRWHIKAWHTLLRLFVGNGYKPERALYWSAGFVLAGWCVFATAGSLGYMAPRDGNVRVSREWNEKMTLPRTYPPFNGLVYALDAYLPVIEFDQDEMWEPSTKKTIPTIHAAPDRLLMFLGLRLPRWLMLPYGFFMAGGHRVLYWIEEIAGWVLVSLFIAGMSGLMKKE